MTPRPQPRPHPVQPLAPAGPILPQNPIPEPEKQEASILLIDDNPEETKAPGLVVGGPAARFTRSKSRRLGLSQPCAGSQTGSAPGAHWSPDVADPTYCWTGVAQVGTVLAVVVGSVHLTYSSCCPTAACPGARCCSPAGSPGNACSCPSSTTGTGYSTDNPTSLPNE